MTHHYYPMDPGYDEFGQLFSPTIPLGGGAAQGGAGMPLGKITLDTTPQLTQRLDRLLAVTEKISMEAATTSQLAIGVAVILGMGAIGAALYKASRQPRYGNE
tara:strand:- start:1676 stop:1984 length:309 start_codon:yes stop_codon:yes gene_type:complete